MKICDLGSTLPREPSRFLYKRLGIYTYTGYFLMALSLFLRRMLRCRSFKKTMIILVVVLVQLWFAIPVLFGQRGQKWPQKFNVVFPQNFEAPFVPLVIFSSYRPRYLERTLESISSSGSIVPSTPCLFILHHTKASSMEDINETYKVLGKITFCRKLVWTFGNEEEERSPEVLKAHWWNTMKKVFDEHGVYFINVWFQKISIYSPRGWSLEIPRGRGFKSQKL